jgi:acetyltransferase
VLALDVRIKLRPAPSGAVARLAIRPYPSELEAPFPLPDGRAARLRPIRPEDAPSITAAFGRLSPESIRMRFFTTMKRMPPDLAARLTQLDYDREMALAVTSPEPPGRAEIFAVVRLSADPDNERAEFAIVVRDDLMRRGIGRRLMERIIAYGRGRGLLAIFGIILAENRAMIELARRLGFRIEAEPGQADLVRATLDLARAAA